MISDWDMHVHVDLHRNEWDGNGIIDLLSQ